MTAIRRLAAILAADVVGYSRLIGSDEGGTLARLKSIRREVTDPKISDHRGRIVKTTGDGVLVEFASVVDALGCATEIQARMAERNASVMPDKRIEFRIGIHQGDIVVEDVGEQSLKNIVRPLRVYRIRIGRPRKPARPALALPDKPSIAVLPFANLSGDPEQDYFADGIVEEIITALSQIR